MAKKGQKFNKYTPEQRKEILEKYLSGQGSQNSLAKEYGITRNTIKTWISAYKQDIPLGYQKKGRPKEENIDYKERYEILKKFQAFIEAQREKK
ncbi:MAG: helix-turn-helix domain-containing protein [Clostridia bacterium]|nr:helix-turn-helix domain-containing protein [Clostridia bacterium]